MIISILLTVFFMCLRENFGRLKTRKVKSEEGDLLGSTASTDTDNDSKSSDVTLIA